jgi:hypothetical protein
MQLAHSTSDWPALPSGNTAPLVEVEVVALLELALVVDREVVAVLVLATEEVAVVVLLTFATFGLPEPPPHPATRTPLMSAAAVSRRARDERFSRLGSMLSCIWAPSDLALGLRTGSTRRAVTGTFRSWSPRDRAVRAAER